VYKEIANSSKQDKLILTMLTVIFGLWLKYIAFDTCFIKIYVIYVLIIGLVCIYLVLVRKPH